MSATEIEAPSLADMETATAALTGRILVTPVVPFVSDRVRPYLPTAATVHLKLELFQHAGSFKARGALLTVAGLDAEAKRRGVATVSAGNHALALSWAAAQVGTHAKVVMPESADPVRVAGCRSLGTEVILVGDVHAAFAEVQRIAEEEGRTVVHPFEGRGIALGTAGCALEFLRQAPDLEVMVIPIGGGGLIAGMASAIKALRPDIHVIGVEPEGADTMHRSFAAGSPQAIPEVRTIADSLGAPTALPYSFALARRAVDELVRIPDSDLLRAMALLYAGLKIAAEPAGAAATGALMGPLRPALAGKQIGAIVCGSNIGVERFADMVAQGQTLLAG